MNRVPAAERLLRLTELLGRQRFVSVTDAAGALGVSCMTVRRDLKKLEGDGVLEVTHGGAMLARSAELAVLDVEEPLFERRQKLHAAAKRRIAAAAAKMIAPDETVVLDVGTTVLALAKEVQERTDLRIFTNSLPAANALSATRSSVYLLGGQLRRPELAIVGPMTLAQIAELHFDTAFIGVSGVTAEGFFDYALEDSQLKRAFIERSKRVIVLADASKFGHRALATVGPLGRCGVLITDAAPKGGLASALKRNGIELRVTGRH